MAIWENLTLFKKWNYSYMFIAFSPQRGVPNGRRLFEKWERNEFIIRIAEYEELEARININNEKFIVDDVKRSQKKRNPSPPFTTSTMQQEASRKINFTLKKTMSVAQGLYEGVKVEGKGTIGLITYMRTDSTRISEEARKFAKEHIVSKYGENYYENRYFKTKDNSQDAHEAIRPTYIELEPDKIKESLTNDQYKLYKLNLLVKFLNLSFYHCNCKYRYYLNQYQF